jgi:Family of unknown function (DUF6010)
MWSAISWCETKSLPKLGCRQSTLDIEVMKERAKLAQMPEPGSVPVDIEVALKEAERAAGKLIQCDDVLAKFGESIEADGLVQETEFAAFGFVGIRVTFALIVGYLMHGLWDAVHELNAHAEATLFARQTTPIPLGYGFFCATYDVLMAVYFYIRRNDWHAVWNAMSGSDAVSQKGRIGPTPA